MDKTIIIVLLFLVVISLNRNSSSEEKTVEQENRITLLSHCEAKFQYGDKYYAICPYDKTLKVSYQEYVEFNKPVQAAPETFVKAESAESDAKGELILLMIGAAFLIVGLFLLVKFFFEDLYF